MGQTIVFGLMPVVVFAITACSYVLPPHNAFCKLSRRIGYVAVVPLVIGVFTPVLMHSFLRASQTSFVWGATLYPLIAATGIASVAINMIGIKERRITALSLYVALFVSCALSSPLVIDILGAEFFYCLISGVALYCAGVVTGLAVKNPAKHILRNIFVAAGAALHFVAVYLYLL